MTKERAGLVQDVRIDQERRRVTLSIRNPESKRTEEVDLTYAQAAEMSREMGQENLAAKFDAMAKGGTA